jgi:hypothetical protein
MAGVFIAGMNAKFDALDTKFTALFSSIDLGFDNMRER